MKRISPRVTHFAIAIVVLGLSAGAPGCIGNPDAIRGIAETGGEDNANGGQQQTGSTQQAGVDVSQGGAVSSSRGGTITALSSAGANAQGGSTTSANPNSGSAATSGGSASVAEGGGGTVGLGGSASVAEGGGSTVGLGGSASVASPGGTSSGPNGGTSSTPTGGTTSTPAGGTPSGGSGGATAVCTPDSRVCVNNSLQRCDSQGQWGTPSPCAFVCDPTASACTGVCTPTTKQCSDTKVQTCSALGQWDSGTVCPNICTLGECTGSCSPSTENCSSATIQRCNLQGTWDNVQICPYICSLNSSSVAQCAGVCKPGTTQCADNRTLQTCDSNGAWGSPSNCTYACAGSSCGGSCVPGAKTCDGYVLRNCLNDGTLDSGTECTYVCSGSACTGGCRPPSVQCGSNNTPQQCTTAGTWLDDTACTGSQLCRNGVCQANPPYNLGQSTQLSTASPASAPSYLYATRITVAYRTSVLKFGMVSGASGANVKFGLYTDSSGVPGALVSQGGPVALAPGNIETASTIAYTLEPGTYWIAAVYSASAYDYHDTGVTNAAAYYASYVYTQALPATFPFGTALPGYRMNYYINVQDVP